MTRSLPRWTRARLAITLLGLAAAAASAQDAPLRLSDRELFEARGAKVLPRNSAAYCAGSRRRWRGT